MLHRKVVVTGAASGVGRALVDRFCAGDDHVVAVDVALTRLHELADEYPQVQTVHADLATLAGTRAVANAAGEGVSVLCNNAGIADMQWIDEITEERWDHVMNVNLKAPFLLSKMFIPSMVAAGGGSIVNTASIAAIRGGRAGIAYTASKTGLVGLTQNIAATFAAYGIRCNAVCPGNVETNIFESVTETSDRALEFGQRDRDKPAPAQPAQVADVIHYLASSGADRVNGAVVTVDGGWTAY